MSAPVRIIAPASPDNIIVDLRLSPVKSLALCGAISPTKLIRPVRLMIAATINVAISNNANLIHLTGTPSIRASPSSSDSIRSCLPNINIIAMHAIQTPAEKGIFVMLMPLRLPIIQYSMDASCFSGSAASLKTISAVCERACTAIPARTIDMLLLPLVNPARISESSTAITPPAKALTVTDIIPDEINTIEKAAPALAPLETPIISGAASGFLKIV